MLDRLFRKSTTPQQNNTSEKDPKPSLDELAKNAQILDQDKMNQIGGGHTGNTQLNDRIDWNSTFGGSIPS